MRGCEAEREVVVGFFLCCACVLIGVLLLVSRTQRAEQVLR